MLDRRGIPATVTGIETSPLSTLPHRRRPFARSRRGLTLLEITVALGLVAAVVALAFPTYRAFEDRGADNVAKATLQSIEAELTRLITSPRWVDDQLYDVVPDRLLGGTGATVGAAIVDQGTPSRDVDGDGRYSVSVLGGSDGAVAVIRSRSGSCFYVALSADVAAVRGSFSPNSDDDCSAGSASVSQAISGAAAALPG